MQGHHNREEEVRPRLPLCLLSISTGQVLSAQTLMSTIVGRVGRVSNLYRDAATTMWAAGSGRCECCLYASFEFASTCPLSAIIDIVFNFGVKLLSFRSNRRPSAVGCRLF